MKECPKCKTPHNKHGIFCSRKCANSHKLTDDQKHNIGRGIKNSKKVLQSIQKRRQLFIESNKDYMKICPVCKIEFDSFIKRAKFCSGECAKKGRKFYSRKEICKPCGGVRNGGGHGKNGWYKGYHCDSSWELAYVIYNLEHGIKFERNHQSFEYWFNGKKFKYYPDFILDDETYIEIKGWIDEKNKIKIESFKGSLLILDKNKIKPYLDYVINKYGKDFVNLYDGTPYDKKKNNCKVCGKPCINKYCSNKCLYNRQHNR